MADTNKNAADFFKAMGAAVSDNRSLLTNDKGVDGTGLGFVELLSLKTSYAKFEESCVKELNAGHDCTAAFNTSGGKKLDVNVSFEKGVDINITSAEGNSRKVNFRPPATSVAKNTPNM